MKEVGSSSLAWMGRDIIYCQKFGEHPAGDSVGCRIEEDWCGIGGDVTALLGNFFSDPDRRVKNSTLFLRWRRGDLTRMPENFLVSFWRSLPFESPWEQALAGIIFDNSCQTMFYFLYSVFWLGFADQKDTSVGDKQLVQRYLHVIVRDRKRQQQLEILLSPDYHRRDSSKIGRFFAELKGESERQYQSDVLYGSRMERSWLFGYEVLLNEVVTECGLGPEKQSALLYDILPDMCDKIPPYYPLRELRQNELDCLARGLIEYYMWPVEEHWVRLDQASSCLKTLFEFMMICEAAGNRRLVEAIFHQLSPSGSAKQFISCGSGNYLLFAVRTLSPKKSLQNMLLQMVGRDACWCRLFFESFCHGEKGIPDDELDWELIDVNPLAPEARRVRKILNMAQSWRARMLNSWREWLNCRRVSPDSPSS